VRQGPTQRFDQSVGDNHMARSNRVERMRRSRSGETGIDQRYADPDPRQPEPNGEVIGTVPHQQGGAVAFFQAFGERPMGIAVAPLRQRPIRPRLAVGEQGRRGVVLVGKAIDQAGKGQQPIVREPRHALKRPRPHLKRRLAPRR